MKIKKIDETTVSAEDLSKYKEFVNNSPKQNMITASDFGMDKRIITVRVYVVNSEPIEITLVNPKIIQSEEPFVFVEKDTTKNKMRKTIRYKKIKVSSDNMGNVEFSPDKENWKDLEDVYSDAGAVECVHIQRLIDALDGIDILDRQRHYNGGVATDKTYGRNDKVMMQNDNGDTIFIKYKKVGEYTSLGYNII
jgi:peptide deformylase